jgi:hypothetical protein
MPLNITEYRKLLADEMNRTVQAGEEPSLAIQEVTIGAGSLQSSVFDSDTQFVRIHAETACHIKFGANPTAAGTDTQLAAGQTEYFGVPAGLSYRVAVIQT